MANTPMEFPFSNVPSWVARVWATVKVTRPFSGHGSSCSFRQEDTDSRTRKPQIIVVIDFTMIVFLGRGPESPVVL
ncbi:MAG: hypothetical protein PUJ58_12605 [Phocaeicola vulgatus]|nr:hypothetical protein [Phocaeicola vulgatus]